MSSIPQLAAANADSKPYWEAAKAGRLVFKKCLACGHVQFPPRHLCPKCWSDKAEWIESGGKGRVHSYSLVHRAPTPAHAAKAPYVIAMIDVDQGPRMLTNIVGEGAHDVRIGDEVTAVFEPEADGSVLPQFQRLV